VQHNAAAVFSLSTILLSAVCACSSEKSYARDTIPDANVDASQAAATGCDASLWNHVYSPKRLRQLQSCVSVTGVITESNVESDGDQHFLLTLDPGQGNLTNKRNAKKKGGGLVLEIICANPSSMKKVKSACAGYTNSIPMPAVGTHVRATGTYVIDSHNGWAEIHPVSKFEAK
jgi:hypothetical protein